MAELSAIWLRVAAALYSLGLLHAILTVAFRREGLLRYATAAMRIGALLHLVAVVEEGLFTGHFPANNVYESLSLCALLVVGLFLLIYRKYKIETLAVIFFPLVFLMTLAAAMSRPVASWSNQTVRDAWLTTHVVLVLLGYASLLLTAAGAVVYLFQERELKRKKPRQLYYRLPPLGTLDELISRSMTFGFVFLTLAVITASIWGFIELGTRWIGDPKIVISMITWVIYLVMVFLRVSAGWRGRKAAIMALTALGCAAVTWVAHSGLRTILAQ
jgi:ABC-type transport system involved in cytochrome c biogenesis permease subunit